MDDMKPEKWGLNDWGTDSWEVGDHEINDWELITRLKKQGLNVWRLIDSRLNNQEIGNWVFSDQELIKRRLNDQDGNTGNLIIGNDNEQRR